MDDSYAIAGTFYTYDVPASIGCELPQAAQLCKRTIPAQKAEARTPAQVRGARFLGVAVPATRWSIQAKGAGYGQYKGRICSTSLHTLAKRPALAARLPLAPTRNPDKTATDPNIVKVHHTGPGRARLRPSVLVRP